MTLKSTLNEVLRAFLNKNFNCSGTKGKFLNKTKTIYGKKKKISPNIVISGEEVKAFPLRSVQSRTSTITIISNIIPEVLSQAIRQEIKSAPSQKRKITTYIHTYTPQQQNTHSSEVYTEHSLE